jgi:hypothetical protein
MAASYYWRACSADIPFLQSLFGDAGYDSSKRRSPTSCPPPGEIIKYPHRAKGFVRLSERKRAASTTY